MPMVAKDGTHGDKFPEKENDSSEDPSNSKSEDVAYLILLLHLLGPRLSPGQAYIPFNISNFVIASKSKHCDASTHNRIFDIDVKSTKMILISKSPCFWIYR